ATAVASALSGLIAAPPRAVTDSGALFLAPGTIAVTLAGIASSLHKRETSSYGCGGKQLRPCARAESQRAPRAPRGRRRSNGRLPGLCPSPWVESDCDSFRVGPGRCGGPLCDRRHRGRVALGVPNAPPPHLSARARLRTGAHLSVPGCLPEGHETHRPLSARPRRSRRMAHGRWTTARARGRPRPAL